jgi:hypothetical protein
MFREDINGIKYFLEDSIGTRLLTNLEQDFIKFIDDNLKNETEFHVLNYFNILRNHELFYSLDFSLVLLRGYNLEIELNINCKDLYENKRETNYYPLVNDLGDAEIDDDDEEVESGFEMF